MSRWRLREEKSGRVVELTVPPDLEPIYQQMFSTLQMPFGALVRKAGSGGRETGGGSTAPSTCEATVVARPGEECPTCQRKVPMTGAQRMAALRERERLKQEARAADG